VLLPPLPHRGCPDSNRARLLASPGGTAIFLTVSRAPLRPASSVPWAPTPPGFPMTFLLQTTDTAVLWVVDATPCFKEKPQNKRKLKSYEKEIWSLLLSFFNLLYILILS
jgi:hypothetical protein